MDLELENEYPIPWISVEISSPIAFTMKIVVREVFRIYTSQAVNVNPPVLAVDEMIYSQLSQNYI